MAKTDRLAKLKQLFDHAPLLTKARLLRELGVSEPTLKRDLALLRDRLNAPVVFDRDQGGWRLDHSPHHLGTQYEMPGMWFSAQEMHALLTMQHLLANLDAGGLLQPHIEPLRKKLARILGTGALEDAEVGRRIKLVTLGARRTAHAPALIPGGGHGPAAPPAPGAELPQPRQRTKHRARGVAPAKDGVAPEIFKALTAKAGERDQGDALIRWSVRELDKQEDGNKIYVQSDDRRTDEHRSLKNRFDNELGKEAGGPRTAELACQKWLDVRAFGQLFAYKQTTAKKSSKKTDDDSEPQGDTGVSIGIRGPVGCMVH